MPGSTILKVCAAGAKLFIINNSFENFKMFSKLYYRVMLCIKFSRIGKKKQPAYRIIILEKAKDPWGDFLEDLGCYNPFTKKSNLKAERIKYWLSKGAQLSDTVHNLLVNEKIISVPKIKTTRGGKARRKAEAAAPKVQEKKEEVAAKA